MVLRFDYDGIGDSAGGSGDPGRVEAWLSSVQTAVDFVVACGVARVSIIGMRLGATLAAVAASRGTKVDAVVLWDPCSSGRSFLRQQRLIRELIGVGSVATDGSVEGPGIVFDPDTARELSDLTIERTEGMLAPEILVLTRSDQKPNAAMMARLSMDHVQRAEVGGQADLIDVPPVFARVPEADLAVIVSWLSALWTAEDTAVEDPMTDGARSRALVARDAEGRAIWESPARLGPNGLFGMVTEAEDRSAGRTVLLLPAGVLDHTGPARLWVELARGWAGDGLRVVRLDSGGVGDSPARGSQSELFVSAPESIDDTSDVIRALTPTSPQGLVLVGICSGGYHAAEAALALPLLGICIMNPSFSLKRTVLSRDPTGGHRLAPASTRRWAKALPAHDLLAAVVHRLPSSVWWVPQPRCPGQRSRSDAPADRRERNPGSARVQFTRWLAGDARWTSGAAPTGPLRPDADPDLRRDRAHAPLSRWA